MNQQQHVIASLAKRPRDHSRLRALLSIKAWPRLRLLLLGIAWLSLSACISTPSLLATPGLEKDQAASQIKASAELQAAVPNKVHRDYAARIIAASDEITDRKSTAGNDATLLIDGPETHGAQIAAINAAKHHVHLNVFIFTGGEIGQRYAKALIAAVERGVIVRVMYDSVGTFTTDSDFFKRLERAGVKLHEFHAVNPTKNIKIWEVHRRDHRKLLIVDGQLAFTGGVNIMDEYLQGPLATPQSSEQQAGWRDTHIQIEGPVVRDFQEVFQHYWYKGSGERFEGRSYFPELRTTGPLLIRVMNSEGDNVVESIAGSGAELFATAVDEHNYAERGIYHSYMAAIALAKEHIWITQSYFAPNKGLVNALKDAAERGVDVRLLFPAESDSNVLYHATRYYYAQLLKAGVRVYEYQPAMLHAKTAVIDSSWSTVGSSNMDFRSLVHNDEINANIINAAFAADMKQLFLNDLRYSDEILPSEWRDRSIIERLKQRSAVVFKYWL